MIKTWGRCTKDECDYQDEQGYCTLPECVLYYMDKETAGDRKYHALKDDGLLDRFGRRKQ